MMLRCDDCGTHFTTDFSGGIATGPCPECGSPRPFRNQPSPVGSDGTLRNMVDSDSQVDQGGNPLGEGTIVGSDGEVPLSTGSRGRDNYMHSYILAALVTSEDWFQFPDEVEPGHGRSMQWGDMKGQPHLQPEVNKDGMTTLCPECKGQGWIGKDPCPQCGGSGEIETQPLRGKSDEGWEEDHQFQQSDIPQNLYVKPDLFRGRTPNYGKTADFESTIEEMSTYKDGVNGFGQGDRNVAEEENEAGDFRIGDQWFDGTDGDPVPRKGSLLAILAAGWMGDDPLEQGKLRCPNCHSEVMTDRGNGELMCVGCDRSWPVHHDQQPGVEQIMNEMPERLPNSPFLVAPPAGTGPVHQGGTMEDVLGLSPQDPQRPPMMRWEPGFHGRGLMIAGEPHTWNAYDPQNFQTTTDLGPYHDEYVKKLGINPHLVDARQGVEIRPNGEIEQLSGRDPTPFIQADPRLKAGEALFDFSSSMTPTPTRTSNVEPYEQLWTREADVEFAKGPDLNAPPVTFTVNPSVQGIHNAHRKHLAFLDAHVNGLPARDPDAWNTIFERHGRQTSPEFGAPVQISVHDPAHIIPLKSQLEQPDAGTSPQFKELVGKIASGEQAPPPGVDPSTIRVASIHTGLAALPELAGAVMDSPIAGAVMKGALFRSGENLLGVGGQSSPQGQPEGQEGGIPINPAFGALAALVMSDYESPMSLPDVGSKPNDPEKVDTKEFNDKDKGTNPVNPNTDDSGASGEDTVRQEQGFAPDSPGMERLNMMLPLLTHYFFSGDPGEDEPMLRSLHETLEAENPGYLDKVTPEDEKRAEDFLKQLGHKKEHGVHAKTALLPPMQPTGMGAPLGGDPNAVQQMVQNQVEPQGNIPVQPGAQAQASQCPNCGGVLNGTGACAQCGMGTLPSGNPQQPMPGGMPQGFASVLAALVDSANHQGPVTPEQIAAVQQLLIKQNRIDEIPNVPLHPENYVREMSEIQQQPNVAPQVTPQEQTQPPAPQMAPPGAMPMPGMGGGEPGGQPMQPMAHSANGSLEDQIMNPKPQHCPECTQPLGMLADGSYHCPNCGYVGIQTLESKTRRYPFEAADSVARRCPRCGSGTTGLLDGEKGLCFCHACANQWKLDGIAEDKSTSAHVAADSVARRCPRCGSGTTGILDGEKGLCYCHACANQWKLDGLSEEKTAAPIDLSNPSAVPAAEKNLTRIDGNEDSSLTWKDTEGMRLQPGHEYEMHNPNFDIPDIVRIERVKPDGLDVTITGSYANDPNALKQTISIGREEMEMQGLTFKPAEEQGAPESNELPAGTAAPGEVPRPQTTDEHQNSFPALSSVEEHDPDSCPKCGYRMITSSMASPSTVEYECYRCAHVWESKVSSGDTEENAGTRNWLNEDSDDDDFFANFDRAQAMAAAGRGGMSRDIKSIAERDPRAAQIHEHLEAEKVAREERTAGKHFSPSEQRALIDEDGFARNSDLLNLSGTHYKTSDEADKVDASRVPDNHFALGF